MNKISNPVEHKSSWEAWSASWERRTTEAGAAAIACIAVAGFVSASYSGKDLSILATIGSAFVGVALAIIVDTVFTRKG